MEAVLHIFGYVKGHLWSKLVLDPAYRNWTGVDWREVDWKEFYPGAMEPIPPGTLIPVGNEAQLNVFCDAAHATCFNQRRAS
jgi:hypothetical protein